MSKIGNQEVNMMIPNTAANNRLFFQKVRMKKAIDMKIISYPPKNKNNIVQDKEVINGSSDSVLTPGTYSLISKLLTTKTTPTINTIVEILRNFLSKIHSPVF